MNDSHIGKFVRRTAGEFPWRQGMSFNAEHPPNLVDIKAAGIACIELNGRALDLSEPEVKARCDRWIDEARTLEVEVWSYHLPYGKGWDPSVLSESGRLEARRQVRAALQQCAEWGIGTVIYHPSYEPIAPVERARRLELCREELAMLAAFAVPLNIRIAVECLPRTCLGNSADEIAFLLSAHEQLAVCCDMNHLFREAPASFIRQIGHRIVTTHISDNDSIDERHWYPGEGKVDWYSVLEALQAVDYRGPLLYEVREQTVEGIAANWRNYMTRIEERG